MFRILWILWILKNVELISSPSYSLTNAGILWEKNKKD